VTRLRTFATERAQRGRRSLVQVCLVKSITSSAVSFAAIVAGLSAGGAGSLALAHSSMTVCACGPADRLERSPTILATPITSLCKLVSLETPAARIIALGTLAATDERTKPGSLELRSRNGSFCCARMERSLSHDVPIGATQVSLAQLNER